MVVFDPGGGFVVFGVVACDYLFYAGGFLGVGLQVVPQGDQERLRRSAVCLDQFGLFVVPGVFPEVEGPGG